MQKDLYLNKNTLNVVIQRDDLKYDGKNLIIPSYWAGSLQDFVSAVNINSIPEADRQDLNQFKDFLFDIEEYNNQGN